MGGRASTHGDAGGEALFLPSLPPPTTAVACSRNGDASAETRTARPGGRSPNSGADLSKKWVKLILSGSLCPHCPPLAAEDMKPVKVESSGGDDGTLINIKVQSQTAADVFFRIKRDVKLRRLMDMYCGRHSLSPKAVQFVDTEGRHIRPAQTADEVGLQDGDAINIMIHMDGGGGAPAETGSCMKAEAFRA